MFEFLDKVWLAWTGWDIIQAYCFGVIAVIVIAIVWFIIASIFSN